MKKLLACVLVTLSFAGFAKTEPQTIKMVVTEKGFEPSTLLVKAGTPVVLKITRKSDATCARDLVIPSQKVKVELPLNKEVAVTVGSLTKGEIKFGCAMNMMVSGVMNVQ